MNRLLAKRGQNVTVWLIYAPPVCQPRVHIRMCIVVYCLKLDVKLDLVIDHFK